MGDRFDEIARSITGQIEERIAAALRLEIRLSNQILREQLNDQSAKILQENFDLRQRLLSLEAMERESAVYRRLRDAFESETGLRIIDPKRQENER